MTSTQDWYTQAVEAAPNLVSSPDLITAAANSGNPAQTAQVLSQSGDVTGMAQAVQHHQTHHHGLFGGLLDDIGGVASSAWNAATDTLSYLGKPLADVQHDYRYIHDLWTKSDPISATLATLGVIGGAVGGGFLGGPGGAALGADAAMSLEGHLAAAGAFDFINPEYQKIYKDSATEKISPGRDLANLLGVHSTDHGLGKLISGAGDLAFDFNMDPIARGLGLAAKGRTGALGLSDTYAARRLPALRQMLLDHGYAGLGMQDSAGISTLDRIQAARNNPQYERAIGKIAQSVQTDGAGGVVSDFPRMARLAPFLAHADTPDKVHEVLLAQAASAQQSHGYNLLPSRTILRSATAPLVTGAKKLSGTASGEAAEGGLLSAVANVPARLSGGTGSGTTFSGAVSQKVRTFSGYLPYTIDRTTKDGKELLDLSTKNFDLLDPGSLEGMYRSLRFSMSEVGARTAIHDIAVAQAHGDVDQVRRMWLGAHKQMLVAAGLPDDHALVRQVTDHLNDAHADVNDRAYGFGHLAGADVNNIRIRVPARPTDAEGTADSTIVSVPAALFDHQGSTMSSFPDFWQVKNSLRAMDAWHNALGSADEFINAHYTRSIFKPLALVNAGFGLRVAVAEALPAAFRYGALHMLQARIAQSSAEHQYSIDTKTQRLLDRAQKAQEEGDFATFTRLTKQAQDGDVGHLTAAVTHLLGGAQKTLRVSDDDLNLATRIVHDGNGQAVWGVGRAGESTHREPINTVDKNSSRLWYAANHKIGVGKTGNWTYYTPDSTQYTDLWQTQLNNLATDTSAPLIAADLRTSLKQGMDPEEAAREATVREADRIRGTTTDDAGNPHYEEGRKRLIRFGAQDPEEFAAARVDAVRNLVTGRYGTFHDHLAKNLEKGAWTDQAVLDRIDPGEMPRMIPGQETIPLPPLSLYNRAISQGFKTLVDPIINHLSREPLFFAAVKEQLPALKSLADKGIISTDDMYREAYYRATEAMLPQIHNVQLRSQFAALTRNFLPFYFAQEQAIKRTAHLATKDPGALRQYQQVAHALTDPNFIHEDDQGNRSLIIPLAGGLGQHVLNGLSGMGLPFQSGLPLSFTGSTESLKTVLPELTTPGTSPLVTVPLNELAKFFPEWSPAVKAVVGDRGFGQPLRNELIPNALLRNTLTAWAADEQDKSFANAMTSALSAAAYHHQLPGPDATPAQRQAFIDRIKNNARSILFMKGILATASPLSPSPVAEDYGLRDEFYKLTEKKGMTYPQAVDKFLHEHGNSAISYTIAKSSNPSGAYIPSTQAALDFIQTNRTLLEGHLSGAYFVPEIADKAGDSQVIHNELVNMGLREKYGSSDFLDQMYIKSGDQTYYADKQAHDTALASFTNPADVAAENTAWSAHVQDLKAANVIWAADFTSEDRTLRAHQVYTDMTHLFATNQAPPGEQTTLIAGLMADYQQHAAALALIPSGTHQVTLERDAWAEYLKTVADEHPELANVVNNVFARLDRRL